MQFIQSQGDYLCLILGAVAILTATSLLLRPRVDPQRHPRALWMVAAALLAVGWWAVEHAGNRVEEQNASKISAMAPTYARELQRMGHARLTLDTPADDPAYQAMIAAQIQWLALNPYAHDIYTMRQLPDGTRVTMVDSETDYNADSVFSGPVEQRTAIGRVHEVKDAALDRAFDGEENFNPELIHDERGSWVSAFVPMWTESGTVDAVLGVDFDAREWTAAINEARRGAIVSVAMALVVLVSGAGFYYLQQDDLRRRRAAEQRMELTLRQMPLGFIEWNPQAEVVRWNPMAEKTFGYLAHEVLGRVVFPLIVAPAARDHVDALWKALLAQKGGSHSINDNLTKDGRLITCEWFNTPIIGHDGEVVAVLSLSKDVTETQRIQKHLQQADRLNAVGELAAGVAHDFNNILTVITGHAGLLLQDGALPDQQRLEVARIGEAASRAGRLTRQLLAFSRQQAMFPKPLQLSRIVNRCTSMLSRWLGEHVSFTVRTDDVPPVEVDAAMFEQVITNLVLNARDALTGPGSISVALESVVVPVEAADRHAAARPGPAVCLTVTDTGSGIAPEHMQRLFEPFFSTKPMGRGTGLGLSVVHGIVQQHGGWITVDSTPGHGTTFRVFLPPTGKPAESETVHANRSARPSPVSQTKTVLLVEDEELVRELARLILERNGFEVLEAADGLEALRVWREHQQDIDLLFTDMVMPNGMTGRQLAAELLADRPDLPVIYASGYSLEAIAPEFSLNERVAFLAKPYLTDQLLRTMRQCLQPGLAA